MRKLEVRDEAHTEPGLGPRALQSKDLFPSLATNLLFASGPVIPTGPLVVSLYVGESPALCNLGVAELQKGIWGRTQFPFFDSTLKWCLKTTLRETFMRLFLILRERAQRG